MSALEDSRSVPITALYVAKDGCYWNVGGEAGV